MDVAVVKYNAGNIQSVRFALNRLGANPIVTDDPELLKKANRVIFPGQGEASSAMRYLKERNLDKVLKSLKQPFLGVCLGMQLMCEHSEENDTTCLGIIPAKVKRFSVPEKVPHMGWNTLDFVKGDLLNGVSAGEFLYFVHSYYVEQGDFTLAGTTYGESFSTVIQKDNFYAVQPHPEKSAETGMKILENFLKIPA